MHSIEQRQTKRVFFLLSLVPIVVFVCNLNEKSKKSEQTNKADVFEGIHWGMTLSWTLH